MNIMYRGLIVAAVAALLGVSGCAGLTAGNKTVSISSDPAGATVYASGARVGATPLRIVPDQVFPPRFVGTSYRAYGTLTIKKPGCKDYSRQVNDYVLSRDIHVKLQCDPNYRAPTASAPASAPASASQPKVHASGTVEFRLRRLESLHKEGLITDQEYRSIRKRILDGL
ncbi:MAG: PEGA domain-containing protein [Gammaproteobacteria bacterium]